MKILPTVECDKCELTFLEEDITVCYHYETKEILGHLCDLCVADWLEHLDTLDLPLGDDDQ